MIYIIASCIIIIAIIVLDKKIKKNKNTTEPNYDSEYFYDEEAYNKASEEIEDFEKNYFERIENGEKSQQFLLLGGQQDCSLIRSLLAADNIPSYVENENINRIYGGTPTAVTGVFALKLFILVNDYDNAYEIVCDYANSKKEDFEKQAKEKHTVLETSSEILTGLFFAPYPVNSEQKSMGITILPKLQNSRNFSE